MSGYIISNSFDVHDECASYNDTVIPSEYRELIQSGDKVPTRSDVASKEDAKREDGDGVHEVLRAYPSEDSSYVSLVLALL